MLVLEEIGMVMVAGMPRRRYFGRMRYTLIAAMAAAWLFVSYPYGLWLFVLCAAGHWSLNRAHQIFRRQGEPNIFQVGRQVS